MARRRFGDYKEDVTRGKYSIVNPKTYKGDSLVQAWLERRKLAGICEYMDTHGSKEEQPRFMSDILRFVIDRAYEQLVSAGLCREWEILPAGEYLESKFRIELNPQERGKKNLNHNLILQERKSEERIRIGKLREFTLAEESKSEEGVGYVFNRVHPLNAEPNEVAWVLLLNNPEGIDVMDVNANISLNVFARGENANISDGIVVIPVPLINPEKEITLFNPLYPTSIVFDAGIEVMLLHPKKSKVLNPFLPKSTIAIIKFRIDELLFTLNPGISPKIEISYTPVVVYVCILSLSVTDVTSDSSPSPQSTSILG
jgi:hypothetical protein